MRSLVAAVAAVVVALLVAAGALGSPTSRVTSASTSVFTDPTGDAGTAADISTVLVSNDANKQITFQINFASAATSTDVVDIYIDSDQNASTGDPNAAGAEWDLQQNWADHTAAVGTWNGSSWVEAPSISTVSVSHNSSDTQETFSINASEIGNPTSGFNFWVDSYDGSGGTGHEDQAPDGLPLWSYTLSSGSSTVQLSVLYLDAPRTARAGHTYLAGMLVQRSDTGDFLGSEGTLSCHASVGGKALHSVAAFVSFTYKGAKVSGAFCDVKVPKTLHGKTLRGKTLRGAITASYQGGTVTKTFFAHIG
jgi:hypothetical protein